jgi:hypothetical protein
MQNNNRLEVEYIVVKLCEHANIEHKYGYKVDIGDKAPLMESKHTLKKTSYNVTPFYFVISDISRKAITISPSDGSVKIVT